MLIGVDNRPVVRQVRGIEIEQTESQSNKWNRNQYSNDILSRLIII